MSLVWVRYLPSSLKGTCSWLVKFVYNVFLPQTSYISSMKQSLNRTTIFKLIVHGTKLRMTCEEKENKQKNATFQAKIEIYLSFPSKLHCAICLSTMFTNEDFMSDVISFYCSILQWFVHFWMTFSTNSIRSSCQIIFCEWKKWVFRNILASKITFWPVFLKSIFLIDKIHVYNWS